jgi:hypothetical protein
MRTPYVPVLVLMSSTMAACATLGARVIDAPDPSPARTSLIARSRVWSATPVAAMDLKKGPQQSGAFPFRATVFCNHSDKKLDGNSPKFVCTIGKDDDVKVKYGGANGEVYGEVLATRLLWALGFGADRMYPVNVTCRGCPAELNGIERPGNESRFDPALIERKMPGAEWEPDDEPGWSWTELDLVNPELGGSARAQRDALKLLAVFMQHTDSKPQQQRVLCLGQTSVRTADSCRRPFLMISDVGLTFGRANLANANSPSGVNLVAWRQTPVWKDGGGCTGNLPKSFTGTLNDPVISEAGRRFLAALLMQLTDRQLRDLFEVARVELRLRAPGDGASGFATVDEWIAAFKQKRDQIVTRHCG